MEDLLNNPKKQLNLNNLISLNLERHVLSALLKQPQIFPEVDTFLTDADFYNKVHQTVFCVIRSSYLKNEKLDKVLLAQKIKNLNIHFFEEVDIFDYIENLFFSNINEKAGIEACKELIKLRIRREICETADRVKEFVVRNGDQNIENLICNCDKIYNERLNKYYTSEKIEDIFDSVESVIEKIGNNPPNEKKFMFGPFPTINRIYGSLHKPSNITIIGARSGTFKTSIGVFINTYIAEKYNVPLYHLDNGEMSELELQIRAVCMFTGGQVPYWALENGQWRNNEEWVKLVRNVWLKVKKIKFYYHDISGLKPIEIISLIRRFSYNIVGRNNLFLVHYDYLKPFDTSSYNHPEWKEMGHAMQDFKNFIKNEIRIPLWASLQLNRLGVTTNKTSSQLTDSEETFGISDRILQQSTHSILLRNKVNEEIADEGNKYGNLKAIFVKNRHLGKDYMDAISPVQISKGKFKKNYINLLSSSFYFEDKGDLNQMVAELKDKVDIDDHQQKLDDIL